MVTEARNYQRRRVLKEVEGRLQQMIHHHALMEGRSQLTSLDHHHSLFLHKLPCQTCLQLRVNGGWAMYLTPGIRHTHTTLTRCNTLLTIQQCNRAAMNGKVQEDVL
jgi:hypothetical protein